MRALVVVLSVLVPDAWVSAGVADGLVVAQRTHGHRAHLVQLTRSAQGFQARRAAPRSFRGLVSDVPQARDVQRVRQLRIAPVGAEPDVVRAAQPQIFALLEQRVVPGALRRERFPQLSYDRLVVVVQDAAGRELDWRLVPNPAILRAESPGPDGRLEGEIIEVDIAELSIAIPDISGADRVNIYRPRWTGTEYLLDPFGEVRLSPWP